MRQIRDTLKIGIAVTALATMVGCYSSMKYNTTSSVNPYTGGLDRYERQIVPPLKEIAHVSGKTCPEEFKTLRDKILDSYKDPHSEKRARLGSQEVILNKQVDEDTYLGQLLNLDGGLGTYGIADFVERNVATIKLESNTLNRVTDSMPGYNISTITTHFPVDKSLLSDKILQGKCK